MSNERGGSTLEAEEAKMDKMAGFKRQKPLVDDDAEEEEEADKFLWTMTNGSQQLISLIVAAAEADQARPTKLDRLAAVCSVLLHDEDADRELFGGV